MRTTPTSPSHLRLSGDLCPQLRSSERGGGAIKLLLGSGPGDGRFLGSYRFCRHHPLVPDLLARLQPRLVTGGFGRSPFLLQCLRVDSKLSLADCELDHWQETVTTSNSHLYLMACYSCNHRFRMGSCEIYYCRAAFRNYQWDLHVHAMLDRATYHSPPSEQRAICLDPHMSHSFRMHGQ